MKAVRPVVASTGAPSLQMRSVGSHSTSGRKKEGYKERTGLNGTVNTNINHKYHINQASSGEFQGFMMVGNLRTTAQKIYL